MTRTFFSITKISFKNAVAVLQSRLWNPSFFYDIIFAHQYDILFPVLDPNSASAFVPEDDRLITGSDGNRRNVENYCYSRLPKLQTSLLSHPLL